MLKRILLPIVAMTVALAQPPAGAGRGKGNPPSFDKIKAYLSLSDTQINSIRSASKEAMEANKPVFEQMRAKRRAMRELTQSGSGDATAIGKAVLEAQELRKQLHASQAKVHEQALSFLSADQKAKLDALKSDRSLRAERMQARFLHLLAAPEGGARQHPQRFRRG